MPARRRSTLSIPVPGGKYPAIAQAWRRNWDRLIPFFAFPEAVRRIIYTTNAIEALNAESSGGRSKSAATSPMTKPRQNSSIWSCVRRRRNGKCRRANGARRKPSSPSCSKTGSSWHDGQPAPHQIPVPLPPPRSGRRTRSPGAGHDGERGLRRRTISAPLPPTSSGLSAPAMAREPRSSCPPATPRR